MKNFNEIAENNSAQTAQTSANVVANANGNENVKGKGKGKDGNDKTKRKPIDPMWRVLAKARKTFDVQLEKTNKVKLKCIENFMGGQVQDTDKFWGDYFEQVAKLLDSRRYVVECTKLGYDAVNIAEHIVFLGSTELNKVLKNGVVNTLKNDVRLYVDRLTPSEYTDKLRKTMYEFSGVQEKVTTSPSEGATAKFETKEGE